MRSAAIVCIISHILYVSLCSYSANVCPANISIPCRCSRNKQQVYLYCRHLNNFNQLKTVARRFPSHIQYLFISNYESSELLSDIFQGVCIIELHISLPYLNFSHSPFESQAECLEQLTLDGGITEEFPIDSLLPLKYLETLSINRCNVSELKDSFWKLKIRHLRMESNNINRIHSKVFPPTLQLLSLADNEVMNLNSSLLLLTYLSYLDISYNKIKYLNDELTGLINLQMLDAKYNLIKTLDDSLHNLSNLKILDLTGNRLVSLGNSFDGLNNLEDLYLGYNWLIELNGIEFQPLMNLKLLFLNENLLYSLGNSLSHLKNLNFLYLQGNQLSEVGTGFSCLNNLRRLVLAYNLFKKLDFFNMEDEQENCHFRESNQLETLNLIGNPLECTSNLTSIISNLTEKNVIIKGNLCLK